MFIKGLQLPESPLEKDFFLLDNFLQELPAVVNQLVERLQEVNSQIFTQMEIKFSISELFKEQFEVLRTYKRNLRLELLTNVKEIYYKLTENGLTENSLNLKMNVLDWFWDRVKDLFSNLENIGNHSLFEKFINQLKSILVSLLSALGINSDIFEEAFDLLSSFLEMVKRKEQ